MKHLPKYNKQWIEDIQRMAEEQLKQISPSVRKATEDFVISSSKPE